MKRFGQLIGVKPEYLESYKKYHSEVWPEINSKISECNIRNYAIFYRDGQLFAYFEYVGGDFDADMKKMADDPKTQQWWAIVKPMQEPLVNRVEGEWWSDMEEFYHLD